MCSSWRLCKDANDQYAMLELLSCLYLIDCVFQIYSIYGMLSILSHFTLCIANINLPSNDLLLIYRLIRLAYVYIYIYLFVNLKYMYCVCKCKLMVLLFQLIR